MNGQPTPLSEILDFSTLNAESTQTDTELGSEDKLLKATTSVEDSEKEKQQKQQIGQNIASGKEDKTSQKEYADADDATKANTNEITADKQLAELQNKHKQAIKWNNQLSRKMKVLEQKLAEYVDGGILTGSEAEDLQVHIEHEHPYEEETGHYSTLSKYAKVWDSEIDNLRKYTDDKEIDRKILAFQHLLKTATEAELNPLFEAFEQVQFDPVALTRAMLKAGEEYDQNVYKDLLDKGGLKNLTKHYQKALLDKQKQIDKLEKELLQFKDNSDYISSGVYRLPDRAQQGTKLDNSIGSLLNQALAGR